MAGSHRARHVGKPVPSREVVTGRRDCITGEFPSAKPAMGHRMVAYEGLLARDYIVMLEDDPRVVSYREEPPAIEWFDGDRGRSYTPDFAVNLDDGLLKCVEVKPWKRLVAMGGEEAFDERERAALAEGYDLFEVWTERSVTAQRVANAALVASERTFVVDEAELHTMRVVFDRVAGAAGRAAVLDLRRRSGLGPRAFRAVVALVARCELSLVEPDKAFDDHALVRLPAPHR